MNTIPTGFIWVVLTVYLESRNQPDFGEKAVAKVILNRAKKNGWPLKNVTLARKQFSCWNDGIDHESNWIKEISVFANTSFNCFTALEEWQRGDTLQGATHYYAPKAMIPKYRVPGWVAGMQFVCEIGDHRFYIED